MSLATLAGRDESTAKHTHTPTAAPACGCQVGNFLLEEDPVFGGGWLSASGPAFADDMPLFEIVLNDTTFKVMSAAGVSIAGGDIDTVNAVAGRVDISAGDGLHAVNGTGGDLTLGAGAGHGERAGAGGRLSLEGGSSRGSRGGAVEVDGGRSDGLSGGSVALLSGASAQSSSGDIDIATAIAAAREGDGGPSV